MGLPTPGGPALQPRGALPSTIWLRGFNLVNRHHCKSVVAPENCQSLHTESSSLIPPSLRQLQTTRERAGRVKAA
jgi:hypothetical protein